MYVHYLGNVCGWKRFEKKPQNDGGGGRFEPSRCAASRSCTYCTAMERSAREAGELSSMTEAAVSADGV